MMSPFIPAELPSLHSYWVVIAGAVFLASVTPWIILRWIDPALRNTAAKTRRIVRRCLLPLIWIAGFFVFQAAMLRAEVLWDGTGEPEDSTGKLNGYFPEGHDIISTWELFGWAPVLIGYATTRKLRTAPKS